MYFPSFLQFLFLLPLPVGNFDTFPRKKRRAIKRQTLQKDSQRDEILTLPQTWLLKFLKNFDFWLFDTIAILSNLTNMTPHWCCQTANFSCQINRFLFWRPWYSVVSFVLEVTTSLLNCFLLFSFLMSLISQLILQLGGDGELVGGGWGGWG